MKYICLNCEKQFNNPNVNKNTGNLLIDALIITCPYCNNRNIDLTEKGKLLIERRAKINKIKNEK